MPGICPPPPWQLLQDGSAGQPANRNLPATKTATAFCHPARNVLDSGAASTLLHSGVNETGARRLAGHSLAQHPQGLRLRHVCRGVHATHRFVFSSLGCSASPASFLIIPSSEKQPLPSALTSPCQNLLPAGQESICRQDGKQRKKREQLKADRVDEQPRVTLGEPCEPLSCLRHSLRPRLLLHRLLSPGHLSASRAQTGVRVRPRRPGSQALPRAGSCAPTPGTRLLPSSHHSGTSAFPQLPHLNMRRKHLCVAFA